MIQQWRDRWRRRHWQPDPALDRYNGLEPVVCITGGSDGIGLALAHEFAADGHALLLVARDPSRLELAAREIVRKQPETHVLTHHVDLLNPENRRGLEAHAASLGYFIDVLVNSAGSGLSGSFTSHSTHNIRDLIELNVTGMTDLCRRLLPGMVLRGRGGILNVSSMAGLVPGPYQAIYYASKAYMNALGRALATEVSGMGVRVTTLAPGAVDTQFHDRMEAQGSRYLRFLGVQSSEEVAKAGYAAFRNWRRFVVPGLIHKVNAIALQVLPNWITVPLMAYLLKPPMRTPSHDGDHAA